ncbi:AzlD domain-containing protein [Saxibacter everestensis]|uniref:AzlD domain-containing protein n=1 Tax=Saxibacter everestensis TaxID=2909229 RepID=A0ABY8QYE2_9MICO|nr:AzlD domain-containing protein [Brevibacteriaceae bacterium ZFBP1038]
MSSSPILVVAVLILAAGTFAFRYAGPALRSRRPVSPRMQKVLEGAPVVLLFAVLSTAALTADGDFSGFARPAGVLVAGVFAWRRAPFVVIVLAAALTTAGLRLLGVP